jgi:hypothetical protein
MKEQRMKGQPEDGACAPNAADKDDRIRILEFQVDHLRAELERLKARHEETIYSVAWHFAWPVRVIERAVRKALSGSRDRGAGPTPPDRAPREEETSQPSARIPAQPPEPLTRARIEARIARRIARPA